jgi:hypothetical protein
LKLFSDLAVDIDEVLWFRVGELMQVGDREIESLDLDVCTLLLIYLNEKKTLNDATLIVQCYKAKWLDPCGNAGIKMLALAFYRSYAELFRDTDTNNVSIICCHQQLLSYIIHHAGTSSSMSLTARFPQRIKMIIQSHVNTDLQYLNVYF